MEQNEIVEKLSEFLNEFYRDKIITTILENKRSIRIDFALLDKFDVELSDCAFETPKKVIEAAEEAIENLDAKLGKVRLNVCFFNLPEKR